jgi:hypothetical protein
MIGFIKKLFKKKKKIHGNDINLLPPKKKRLKQIRG